MESLIGKTIDNYRILEEIGRNGIGNIFKAVDIASGKLVSLTMVDPELVKKENIKYLLIVNARALARIFTMASIPDRLVVEELRETEFGFFLVMEYIEAKSLLQHIMENGPFAIKDTILLSKQILIIVGQLHKVYYIQGDIKPGNIYFDDNGKIRLTLYALTKYIKQIALGSSKLIGGTFSLCYSPPEIAKGFPGKIDKRSDIYSLGMTIYEMIVGRGPFEKTDSNYDICKKIVKGEISSPKKFNSEIPKKLAKIILKSINKEPKKRYQSAEDMLSDIEKFEKEFDEVKNFKNLFKRKSKIPTSTPIVE